MPNPNGDKTAAGEAFWRFSLALYARPGVAEALIALQDRAALEVNLILFGLWFGARQGRRLSAGELTAA
ncbi:MAG: TIGR02444 family protein, partial [Stellaceae bacterium]